MHIIFKFIYISHVWGLTDQPTSSDLNSLEDTQQGCLSSVMGLDFLFVVNLLLLSRE